MTLSNSKTKFLLCFLITGLLAASNADGTADELHYDLHSDYLRMILNQGSISSAISDLNNIILGPLKSKLGPLAEEEEPEIPSGNY